MAIVNSSWEFQTVTMPVNKYIYYPLYPSLSMYYPLVLYYQKLFLYFSCQNSYDDRYNNQNVI